MKNFLICLWVFFFLFLKISFSNDFAYITNQLSNSVSVIDLENYISNGGYSLFKKLKSKELYKLNNSVFHSK